MSCMARRLRHSPKAWLQQRACLGARIAALVWHRKPYPVCTSSIVCCGHGTCTDCPWPFLLKPCWLTPSNQFQLVVPRLLPIDSFRLLPNSTGESLFEKGGQMSIRVANMVLRAVAAFTMLLRLASADAPADVAGTCQEGSALLQHGTQVSVRQPEEASQSQLSLSALDSCD
eukprot:5077600-Amphidinium_carterae.1